MPSKKTDKTYVEVKTKEGDFIRAYTEKDQGENFADLAEEFAKKNGYVVV